MSSVPDSAGNLSTSNATSSHTACESIRHNPQSQQQPAPIGHNARQQTKDLDFSQYCDEVRAMIHEKHGSLQGSELSKRSSEIFDRIVTTINHIASKATDGTASIGTKISGLETLRQIGVTICKRGRSVIFRELGKQFQGGHALEDAMDKIAISMSDEEHEQAREAPVEGTTFIENLLDLDEFSARYRLFLNMRYVIVRLDDDIIYGESGGEDDSDE